MPAVGGAATALVASAACAPGTPDLIDAATDFLAFLHIPKTGGSSLEAFLTTCQTASGSLCDCEEESDGATHNGHSIDPTNICTCPRGLNSITEGDHLVSSNWLLVPRTTGWLGGVNRPLHLMHEAIKGKLSDAATRSGVRYLTFLRSPIERIISEFYESYDGWEDEAAQLYPHALSMYAKHGGKGGEGGADTGAPVACSRQLDPAPERPPNVDSMSVEEYNLLFPNWLACKSNMAANRITRSLVYGQDETARRLCDAEQDSEAECELKVARHVLENEIAFVGLSDYREASEELLLKQFGLRRRPTPGGHTSEEGIDAHDSLEVRLSYETISPEQQARVRELTDTDSKVFALAEELFERRLRAYGVGKDGQNKAVGC